MRPAAIAFAIAGFIVSAGAAALVADFAVAKLEDATLRNSKSALVASGQSWAEIETNGTLVYISGTAPDDLKRMKALDAISSVVSSNRIKNSMDVEESIPAIAPDFALEILRSGADVSLIGITPKEVNGDTIRTAVDNITGLSLIDMKESTTWDAPDGWQTALDFGAELVVQVERARISILPAVVNLTAVVKSDKEKQELLRKVTSLQPEGVTLTIDITAPRPIFSPYTLNFVANADKTTLSCYALTEAGSDKIRAAARNAGAENAGECEIGLGAPTTDWADAAVAGIDAVAQMGSGEFAIQDSGATLIAPEGFEAQTFNTITEELRNSLSASYSLKAILPEIEKNTNDDVRPYFHAQLRTDGTALLEGVIIDEISKRTLLTYAEAKFGHDTVTDITHIADFAPHGWTSRQLVALEVLGLLIEGNINVTEDTVAVTGTGEIAGLYDAIRSKLEVSFGADARFTITVEEIIPEPVKEDLPDAKECENEISALLAENQIVFAPSSALIESSSVKTINEIVKILNRCKHAAFEIGGHTDSQGREEMNESLSQTRADAVLDSLLARNMLLGELTAVGYGESQPIADNETEEGRQLNRRIAFKLLEETPDGQN